MRGSVSVRIVGVFEDEAAGLARSGSRADRDAASVRIPGSRASGFSASDAAMPRICASVPYSSSSPCTASTGQAMVASSASMFQARNVGREPGVVPAAERRVGVGVVARQALRAGRSSRRRRAPARCSRSTRPRRRGAARRRPRRRRRMARRVQQRDRAAVAVAEEPGPLDAERGEAAPAAPRAPARCMKSGGQRSSRGLRRRAAVAVAREHEAARGRAPSQNARGKSFHIEIEPRPSCRKTTTGASLRGAPTHSYSMLACARPRQSSARDAASSGDRSRSRAAPSPLALAQAEALDLAGRRLRQLVDELDRRAGTCRRASRSLTKALSSASLDRCARLERRRRPWSWSGPRRPRCRSPRIRAPPGAASASPRPRTARRRCRSP